MSTTSSLAADIRASTQSQHKKAETQSFVTHLMQGQLTLEDYSGYLIQLAWLYKELESLTTSGTPFPSSEKLWDDALLRSDAINQDLIALGHRQWQFSSSPTPAMADYINHLQQLGNRANPLLIAHHYTRYLGDLSGGQAIAALVARHYGATSDQLGFYDFHHIKNIVRYKEQYRSRLDSLKLSTEQRKALIAEAQLAFDFNTSVFAELGSR